MQRWRYQVASRIVPVGVLILSLFVQFIPTGAEAAFTSVYIRLDRMAAATISGFSVCAKTATSGTEAKVVVTFPTGYVLNGSNTDYVVDNTDIPVGTTFWPGMTNGSTTASSLAGQVLTFPSGDISNTTTTYCFHVVGNASTLTTGSVGTSQQASVETQTGGSSPIDHGDVALANISNDQITVSATVPPTFIFTLSGNTDNFGGNLDPSTVKSSAGRTVTVTTNAKGGWIAWAKDTEQGLRSASAAYTIPTAGTVNATPNTLSAGTEGYVLDVDLTTDASGGCTVAIDAEYNGTTTSMGGTFSGTFQPIAACTGAPPATANGDVVTLIERVAIAGATPAGSDYSDIITVVGAGNF